MLISGALAGLFYHGYFVECMPPRQTLVYHPPPQYTANIKRKVKPLEEGGASSPVGASEVTQIVPKAPASEGTGAVAIPARDDGVRVRKYARGDKREALDVADDPSRRAEAVTELQDYIHAATARGPRAQKLRTWKEISEAAGHAERIRLTPDLIYDVVAALWKAEYRSIESYLSIARQEMTLQYGDVPAHIGLHLKRACRAAVRGRGPSRQASELPLKRFVNMEFSESPNVEGGPVHPSRVAIIATWSGKSQVTSLSEFQWKEPRGAVGGPPWEREACLPPFTVLWVVGGLRYVSLSPPP